MSPVPVLVETHPSCRLHHPGAGHPERPQRLDAVLDGLERPLAYGGAELAPPAARCEREDLMRVHAGAMLDGLEAFCRSGGGRIDQDTSAVSSSWDAALFAAGAVVDALARLRAGEADCAFAAVRPPGHHATPEAAMGFCLINNVAVAAARLAAEGERVLIVDFDVHHGNGTQDAFYHDCRVAYASLHEWPLYPGTGRADEVGAGEGEGWTLNVPLPPGATGDVYLEAFDSLIGPFATRFQPDWLIVSAGFDAHVRDPLADLCLSAGDFAALTSRLATLVQPGRRVMVLEGGYDAAALSACTESCVSALAGLDSPGEALTAGGPGRRAVAEAGRVHPLI